MHNYALRSASHLQVGALTSGGRVHCHRQVNCYLILDSTGRLLPGMDADPMKNCFAWGSLVPDLLDGLA